MNAEVGVLFVYIRILAEQNGTPQSRYLVEAVRSPTVMGFNLICHGEREH